MEIIVTTPFMPFSTSDSFLRRLRAVAGSLCVFVAACGGGADAPPPDEGAPTAVAPVITQQPVDLSVTSGQPASFTVAATGTAPLAYQWQRNGATITGATAATYSIAATAPIDTGAVFSAVVSNIAGSATSNNAVLTVTTAAPVLTITQQPADVSVVAGSTASFTVAATCSSGTLNIEWQRNSGVGGAFVAIAGATATSVSVSPAISDSGARFQAALNCSGQSATTSNAAALTVTAPGGVLLDLLPTVGLRDAAHITPANAIDRNADDSFTVITSNRFQKLSADLLSITPLAGTPTGGSTDGPAATATFNGPLGLTHDTAGNIYVADTGNHLIRRIAADGTVTTLAGAAGVTGTADGTGSAARFSSPTGIALGPDGDLYVTDAQNSLIRRVTMAGVVTTYAGSGGGYVDSANPLAAKFAQPYGIAVAANGDVLVADFGNSRVRRILRSGTAAGAVQTLAGNGSTNPDAATPDGIGTAAVIVGPRNMVISGNTLTVRDSATLVRQIDLTTAAVTTFTGTRLHPGTVVDGPPSMSGLSDDGGITTAPAGGFMVTTGRTIHSIDANGVVQIIANDNSGSSTDAGTGVLKQLPLTTPAAPQSSSSAGLTVDPAGNVVVAPAFPTLVRRVSPTGVVTTIAGLSSTSSQEVDGTGSQAQFASLGRGLTHDAAGSLYVADACGVRKIDAQGAVTLLTGQRYNPGSPGSSCGAADGNASTALFRSFLWLTMGTDGNLYVVDTDNYAVRRVDAVGNVTTIAGALHQQGSADGPVATARFLQPQGIATAPDGSLLVLDAGKIRRISADFTTVSTIDTSSVTGQISPTAIAVDADGTMYFGAANGLWSQRLGQTTATRLIPGGPSDAVVLGASPHLTDVIAITVLAPKQLVLVSEGKVLKVTLP